MRTFILAAMIVSAPQVSHADTQTFLDELKKGTDCYSAYHKISTEGKKDWESYGESMAPVIGKLVASYDPHSWKDFETNRVELRGGKRVYKRTTISARDVEPGEFLNYLSNSGKEARIPPKEDFRTNDEILQKHKTFFIQFKPDKRPQNCKNTFRMSLSINEELREPARYQELAHVLESVLLGELEYLSYLTWLKIETPEKLRVDPILLRFCYDNRQKEPNLGQVDMIVSEVNKRLEEINFVGSKKQYPPVQGRRGQVSVADYTNGYSFGRKMCGYFNHYLDKREDPATATESFEAFWTKNVGEFEKVIVPDLSELVQER